MPLFAFSHAIAIGFERPLENSFCISNIIYLVCQLSSGKRFVSLKGNSIILLFGYIQVSNLTGFQLKITNSCNEIELHTFLDNKLPCLFKRWQFMNCMHTHSLAPPSQLQWFSTYVHKWSYYFGFFSIVLRITIC